MIASMPPIRRSASRAAPAAAVPAASSPVYSAPAASSPAPAPAAPAVDPRDVELQDLRESVTSLRALVVNLAGRLAEVEERQDKAEQHVEWLTDAVGDVIEGLRAEFESRLDDGGGDDGEDVPTA